MTILAARAIQTLIFFCHCLVQGFVPAIISSVQFLCKLTSLTARRDALAMTRLLLFLLLALIETSGAQSLLPVSEPTGLWWQIDDKSGKLQSIVRIGQINGIYEGIVEKIVVAPGEDPHPRCDKCRDARKDQPIQGMKIITNLKRTGSTRFEGGEVLDPDSGEIYRLTITMIDGNDKLDVRGFMGFSLFGRSQIWVREK
jgi:uncharacterized protein (DUF2147 family)